MRFPFILSCSCGSGLWARVSIQIAHLAVFVSVFRCTRNPLDENIAFFRCDLKVVYSDVHLIPDRFISIDFVFVFAILNTISNSQRYFEIHISGKIFCRRSIEDWVRAVCFSCSSLHYLYRQTLSLCKY